MSNISGISSHSQAIRPGFNKLYNYVTGISPAIGDDAWQAIQRVFESHVYERKEVILRSGQRCEYVWFINRGIVEKYYIVDGKERVNDLIPEHNFFSDFNGFLFQVPAMLSIRALEATETLRIKYTDVQFLYSQIGEADRIGRLIAERMLVLQSRRIEQLTLMSPVDRYREFLAASPKLMLRVAQHRIASYLGMTPESLSRIKARLKGR